ncbi:MAG TPA: hypothetical protein VJV79_20720, partial [Polyangiaceae bacterium]|nr:hypothetical protein [Polyangiaceae bacterium]
MVSPFSVRRVAKIALPTAALVISIASCSGSSRDFRAAAGSANDGGSNSSAGSNAPQGKAGTPGGGGRGGSADDAGAS